MSTGTTTVYCIDGSGNYLGGFAGVTMVDMEEGEEVEVTTNAVLPVGAIRVPTAPTDARAVFSGFSVTDGAAVGGSWNYSGIPAVPDVDGFIQAIKGAMGGIVQSNGLAKAYPLFYPALQQAEWADAAALIEDAHNTNVLNSDQYAAFKSLAAEFNIPVTLP